MSGDDGTITLDEACAALAATLRGLATDYGACEARIEVRPDGRVELRVEDSRGHLIGQARAEATAAWPTDPKPSKAIRHLFASTPRVCR